MVLNFALEDAVHNSMDQAQKSSKVGHKDTETVFQFSEASSDHPGLTAQILGKLFSWFRAVLGT